MTRFQRQQELESLLVQFSGDPNETAELLAALMAGLANRVDRDKLSDVDHEYEQMKEALEAVQVTPTEADFYYEMADRKYDEWAQAQIDQEEEVNG